MPGLFPLHFLARLCYYTDRSLHGLRVHGVRGHHHRCLHDAAQLFVVQITQEWRLRDAHRVPADEVSVANCTEAQPREVEPPDLLCLTLASGADQADGLLPDWLLVIGGHGQQQLLRVGPEGVAVHHRLHHAPDLPGLLTKQLDGPVQVLRSRDARAVASDGEPDWEIVSDDEAGQPAKLACRLLC